MINIPLLGIAGQVMSIVDMLKICFNVIFWVMGFVLGENLYMLTLIRIKILSTCQILCQGS
jgi:hypothetical protein